MKLKKVSGFIYTFLMISFGAIAVMTALSVTGIPKSLRIFAVQSGSMAPAIKRGSIAVVIPQSEYKLLDVITYHPVKDDGVKSKSTITHRIMGITTSVDKILFTTKGDSNDIQDMEQVPSENVIGKVAFAIPFLGYPIGFAKTTTGLIFLIIIPSTIIVYNELLSMKSEIKNILAKSKRKPPWVINRLFGTLIIFLFAYVLPTQAGFNDSSKVKENTVSSGTWEEEKSEGEGEDKEEEFTALVADETLLEATVPVLELIAEPTLQTEIEAEPLSEETTEEAEVVVGPPAEQLEGGEVSEPEQTEVQDEEEEEESTDASVEESETSESEPETVQESTGPE